jgi:NADH-quinone oxidoreductase subunit L
MDSYAPQIVLWLIPLAPLASAGVTALLGPRMLRERSHWPCWLSLAAAFACSLVLTLALLPAELERGGGALSAAGYEWLSVGDFRVGIHARADAMSSIMLSMVTGVSLLVAVFAAGYMHHDPGYARFFAAVSLFVFSMCMLVLSASFLQLYVFWEAVGLCSYLLIGFWFARPSAAAAAKKAFVVNRIGDFGFLLGIFLVWTTFGSMNFEDVLGSPERLAEVAAADPGRITLICLLLFLGAMGKSAQFPLHVWLPDAMEGPTPVSALIHAATMVTAGVYLVARCTPLFVLSPTAQLVVAGIGALTALIAALTALTQMDLKRVMAYSTVSQLGYMFMGLGAGLGGAEAAALAVTAAMFHLFTHAFFKALLFLASGSVMHAMGDVIDMGRFSGLRKALPITHWTFLCGAAALAGVPLLAGFWSKDEILAALSAASEHKEYGAYYSAIFAVAAGTAVLTAFYTFRAYFMTFWGEERFPEEAGHHPHEATPVMAWPLRILAVCAVAIGAAVGPTHLFAGMLQRTPGLAHPEPHMHWSLMAASGVMALAGIALAYIAYVASPAVAATAARSSGPLYRLSLNKFYFDEIFSTLIVQPVRGLAWLATLFDKQFIDRLVDTVGRLPTAVSGATRWMHNGVTSSYAFAMWMGVLAYLCLLMSGAW